MLYERIIAAVAGTPWAIEHHKALAIASILSRRSRGEMISETEIQAAVLKRRDSKKKAPAGNVAVVPIFGTLMPRGDWFSQASGLMSCQELGVMIDDLAADDSVDVIVLDVDSPGGSVHGVPELAGKIADAAKKKKVIAVADSLAASGGYWLASQASELVVSPGGEVGSIGVFVAHVDQSEANKQAGVSVTFVKAGERKTAGHPHAPLDEIGTDELQSAVNDYYQQFVKDVAKGRNVSQTKVREDFGKGGMLRADAAVRAGMADRVATIDDVLGKYGLRMTPDGPSALASASEPKCNLAIEIRKRQLKMG